MAGLDVDFQMVPFRGEYYRLDPKHNDIVDTLIYPVPDPDLPFLGVHLTLMMDGGVTVGPNAVMGFSREAVSYTHLDVYKRQVLAGLGREEDPVIVVDELLARREAEGNPLRVGIAGPGFMAKGLMNHIINTKPGMEVACVYAREAAKGVAALANAGREGDKVAVVDLSLIHI